VELASRDDRGGLDLNPELVQDLLVRFIKDETQSAGFDRGVIGLSGGVDSALVAALMSKALGRDGILAVVMPYRESSKESVEDAAFVAKELGIRTEIVDISPMADAWFSQATGSDKVRRGNVLARLRMIVLYDISAREQALVVGTSNKTELLLGYGTLHGDMASAINPLGDLYKTQVWELAKAMKLPERVVSKKPTADLWVGQTDEGELGFSDEQVDRLLYLMVDERRKEEELLALGFDRGFIRRVQDMMRKNQFKRRPPVIAKISYRTVNVDFRYVRDWGT